MSNQKRYEEQLQQATEPLPDSTKIYPTRQPPVAIRRNRNQFGAFKMTETGIEVGDHATQEDWQEVGAFLFGMERAFQWLIGDWLAFGEDVAWGDIPDIAEQYGANKDTLANYASISRHCHVSLRHEKLTYSHHVVIAREDLTDEQKSLWLQIAEKEQWSVRKLRTEFEKAQLPAETGAQHPAPSDDAPALSGEIEEEATPIDQSVTVREIKKKSREFIRCVSENRLLDMPRDDFYLLVQYVQNKWAEYKRLSK